MVVQITVATSIAIVMKKVMVVMAVVGDISLSAASISNAGVISARGQNPEFGGRGGGGTIVVNVSENFTSTGTISAAGGTTGVGGGNGRVKLIYSSGSNRTVIGEQ